MLRIWAFALMSVSHTGSLTTSKAPDYFWPLKLRPELTSRFCDYRAGHFHGGLDIRTQGKTGFKVYAAADGYVYRVTTGFKGFGKALYLKLKDGRLAVYGHLSRFSESLDDRVWRSQIKEQKYDQDLYFTGGEYPVKKGQMVAFSGSSGTGAPHLHLELRSPLNNPMNPLEFAFRLHDRVPPEFRHLAVRYYNYGFHLGDPSVIEFLPAIKAKESGEYTLRDTIATADYVALAVSGGDRTEGAGFLYGFFGLSLEVDDSLVFQMTSDSLSFNTTRELNYVRDLELIRLFSKPEKNDNDEGIFYRLYVPSRADQFFWQGFSDGAGVIPPGKPGSIRKITVTASDEAGNQSRLSFYLKAPDLVNPDSSAVSYFRMADTIRTEIVTPVKISSASVEYRDSPVDVFKRIRNRFVVEQSKRGNDTLFAGIIMVSAPPCNREYRFKVSDVRGRVSAWQYSSDDKAEEIFTVDGSPHYLRIRFKSRAAVDNPILSVAASGEAFTVTLRPDGPRTFAADVVDSNMAGLTRFVVRDSDKTLIDTEVVLFPVFPDRSAEVLSPDSTLKISFKPGSAFFSTYVFPSSAKETRIYDSKAIIYQIQPLYTVAKSPLRFTFDTRRLNLDGRRIGVYGYSEGNGDWTFISKINGSQLEAPGFGLGELALIEDNDPPTITSVMPGEYTRSAKPLLSCVVSDKISGLALDDGISMALDDSWVPAEYDIDSHGFSYRVRNPLKLGKHKLEIKAADNQGNSTSKKAYFTVLGKY